MEQKNAEEAIREKSTMIASVMPQKYLGKMTSFTDVPIGVYDV